MLKQVKDLSKQTEKRFTAIWKHVHTKNREPIHRDPAWGEFQPDDPLTIGEKVDAIIDYLGIEIVKSPATPPTVVVRKKKK
jgi:hypothetical protein